MLQMIFLFPASISGQFPEWSHFPPGNIVTLQMVSSTDLEVQVFTSSVELPLKASETVIPCFFKRAFGLQNDKCFQFPAFSQN